MKNTKRSLWASAISLLLCFSMLLGTTYAWFTDSAVSGSNIITAGNLDANMYFSDTLLDAESSDWENAEGESIFTYDKWEPGYTEVKYLKIENAGNLSFKWRLYIKADGEVTKLADVIDVYYVNPIEAELTSLDGLTCSGNLNNVIANGAETNGVLLPDGESAQGLTSGDVIIALALHMQENAGNEYKGLSIGDGFSVTLVATQYGYEQDQFGNSYDTGATWPNPVGIGKNSATVPVTQNNGVNAAEVSVESSNGKVGATIPAGVKLADGATSLTLTVKDMPKSSANVTLDENEASLSIDVHIDGVAEDNDVVMAISVKELLPPGLNMGNYRFYHVEDGVTVKMTLLENGATPVHNNFEYDELTGDVVLHIKSFSEVTLVANNENKWQGGVATGFAAGTGTEDDPYIIVNADQLVYFAHSVGGMLEGEKNGTKNSYEGEYIKLISDINLGDTEGDGKIFYPIGYYNDMYSFVKTSGGSIYSNVSSFEGTFDGNGNTIKNFYQNTWEMYGDYNDGYSGTPNHYKDGMGLFGYVYNGTVKNLTVESFSSDGEFTPTGVIAAFAAGNSTFENISVLNCNPRVYNTGNGGIIGIAGDTSNTEDVENITLTLKNITVDQTNKISALWGSWDVACGGLIGMFRGYSKLALNNCHVAAEIDVNNDVCANYQYYWYRYAGMFIGSVRRNAVEGGYTVAYTDTITAENCTYTLGRWNEYWYCELVANSLASYTHDHQFSRLTKISDVSEIQDENGNWNKTGNFVIPAADNSSATCYHIMKNAEGELYQHFHDVADESNPNIYETFDLNGDGELNDLKEDRFCYFMPFNQIMNGDGYGVKAHYTFGGIKHEEDGTVKSEAKFEAVSNKINYTVGADASIKVGDIFKLADGFDETKLSQATLYVFVSALNDNDETYETQSFSLQLNNGDWENTKINLTGFTGPVKVVITDYFYCLRTTAILVNEGAETKFDVLREGHGVGQKEARAADFFQLKDGAVLVGDVTVTVTYNGETVKFSDSAENWKDITFAMDELGQWVVTITDDDGFCAVSVVNVTVFDDFDSGDNESGEDFV